MPADSIVKGQVKHLPQNKENDKHCRKAEEHNFECPIKKIRIFMLLLKKLLIRICAVVGEIKCLEVEVKFFV